MDTPTALSTLEALKQTIDSNITGFSAQSDALAVAIAQLQNILDTPSADLVKAKTDLAKANDMIATLETQIATNGLVP